MEPSCSTAKCQKCDQNASCLFCMLILWAQPLHSTLRGLRRTLFSSQGTLDRFARLLTPDFIRLPNSGEGSFQCKFKIRKSLRIRKPCMLNGKRERKITPGTVFRRLVTSPVGGSPEGSAGSAYPTFHKGSQLKNLDPNFFVWCLPILLVLHHSIVDRLTVFTVRIIFICVYIVSGCTF